MNATRWSRSKAAMSQLLCVILVDGHEDEMLSSYAWRTESVNLIWFLDLVFGAGHCKESYEWEQLRPRH